MQRDPLAADQEMPMHTGFEKTGGAPPRKERRGGGSLPAKQEDGRRSRGREPGSERALLHRCNKTGVATPGSLLSA